MSPQLLHGPSRPRKAHGFSALVTQPHDFDIPPGWHPTAPQHFMVTSLVPGEEEEPQDAPPCPPTPPPDTLSLCYSDAVQTQGEDLQM